MAYYLSLGVTLIVAITVHEFAHAYAADQLGDTTPRRQGRLTLNPLAHLDPLGSLLFIATGFGWGKPVLTNPYNFRTSVRTGMAIVAAAGPFSNLAMAILAAIPLRSGIADLFGSGSGSDLLPSLPYLLTIFVAVNVGLMFLNLIPIAPLDGYKVALGLLPDDWADGLARLEPYGPLLLLLVIMSGRFGFDILGLLIGAPQQTVTHLLLRP